MFKARYWGECDNSEIRSVFIKSLLEDLASLAQRVRELNLASKSPILLSADGHKKRWGRRRALVWLCVTGEGVGLLYRAGFWKYEHGLAFFDSTEGDQVDLVAWLEVDQVGIIDVMKINDRIDAVLALRELKELNDGLDEEQQLLTTIKIGSNKVGSGLEIYFELSKYGLRFIDNRIQYWKCCDESEDVTYDLVDQAGVTLDMVTRVRERVLS